MSTVTRIIKVNFSIWHLLHDNTRLQNFLIVNWKRLQIVGETSETATSALAEFWQLTRFTKQRGNYSTLESLVGNKTEVYLKGKHLTTMLKIHSITIACCLMSFCIYGRIIAFNNIAQGVNKKIVLGIQQNNRILQIRYFLNRLYIYKLENDRSMNIFTKCSLSQRLFLNVRDIKYWSLVTSKLFYGKCDVHVL